MRKKEQESHDNLGSLASNILDEVSKEESLRTDRGLKKDIGRVDTPKFDQRNGISEHEEANFDVLDLENEFDIMDMQKCK